MTTDAPKTIAEMREAAAKVADTLHYPDETKISASIRDAFRAIPLPADDAEMVERVAEHPDFYRAFRMYCEARDFDDADAMVEWRKFAALAALSAMRGEP